MHYGRCASGVWFSKFHSFLGMARYASLKQRNSTFSLSFIIKNSCSELGNERLV